MEINSYGDKATDTHRDTDPHSYSDIEANRHVATSIHHRAYYRLSRLG